jgi:hypothetical protein
VPQSVGCGSSNVRKNLFYSGLDRAPEYPRKGRPRFSPGALIVIGIMKLLLARTCEYAIVNYSSGGNLPPYNVS